MKNIVIAVGIGVVVVGAVYLLAGSKNNTGPTAESNLANVSLVEGKQIIEIEAKGGYEPRLSVAKAGIPTILRFNTKGTFDCSSSIRIPSLNIAQVLPNTGSTDLEIGIPEAGTLEGSCGMGMYFFAIDFQN